MNIYLYEHIFILAAAGLDASGYVDGFFWALVLQKYLRDVAIGRYQLQNTHLHPISNLVAKF